MFVKDIPNVLDLTLKAREKGQLFIPMFAGDAGIGKSFSCQQWVLKQRETDPSFGFVDLRIAQLEAPDLVGLPKLDKDVNGVLRTQYAIPNILPTSGRGLLLLEEPNRGKSDIMNALMQLLTDRKIHEYTLPEGWIIAACINPEGHYDVANMDPALKNRFVDYYVEFDKPSFVNYIEENKWHPALVSFIKNQFVYISLDEIKPDQKYISPRTLEQMNAALISGIDENETMHLITATAILGKNVGTAFHAYLFDDSPVTYKEVKRDFAKAMEKLKKHAEKSNYRSDLISSFVDEIIANVDDLSYDKKVEILKVLPQDQAATLLSGMTMTIKTKEDHQKIKEFLQNILKESDELREVVRSAKYRQING